jgi:hypothetical protein
MNTDEKKTPQMQIIFVTANYVLRTIPTGLRPPAQGWRTSAYLGFTFRNTNNLNEVATVLCADENGMAATALRLGIFADVDRG